MVPRNSCSNSISRCRLSRYRQQKTSCSRSRRRAMRNRAWLRGSRALARRAASRPAAAARFLSQPAARRSGRRSGRASAQNRSRSAASSLRSDRSCEHLARQIDRRLAAHAAAQQDRQQFRIAERGRAIRSSSFSRGRSSRGQSRIPMHASMPRRAPGRQPHFGGARRFAQRSGGLVVPGAAEAADTAFRPRTPRRHRIPPGQQARSPVARSGRPG
jgi:hypothetical protein